MNDGIFAANGEYIGIVESDDYILPDMYKKLWSVALAYGFPDIVKGDFKQFQEGRTSRSFKLRKLTQIKAYYDSLLNPSEDCGVLRAYGINPPGIYKASFLSKHSITFNTTPGASYQDNGFWFQLFSFATSAVLVPEAFYMVRRDNPNSSVRNKGKVYAICGECDHIRSTLIRKKAPNQNDLYMCAVMRFGNYLWTIERIAPEFRRDFIRKFASDFKKIEADGELSRWFFKPEQWNTLKKIMADPEEYYFTHWYDFGSSDAAQHRISDLENELKKERKKRRSSELQQLQDWARHHCIAKSNTTTRKTKKISGE